VNLFDKPFLLLSSLSISFFNFVSAEEIKPFEGFSSVYEYEIKNKEYFFSVNDYHTQKVDTPYELIFLAIYKKNVQEHVKRANLESFAFQMSVFVAHKNNWRDLDEKLLPVNIRFIELCYEQKGRFFEDHKVPGKGLTKFLSEKVFVTNFDRENKKLVILPVSGAMRAVSFATQQKEIPKKGIHTIVGIDPSLYVFPRKFMDVVRSLMNFKVSKPYGPDFEKIEHRFYNFYTFQKKWRPRRKIFAPFESEEKPLKAVNIRCLFEDYDHTSKNVLYEHFFIQDCVDGIMRVIAVTEASYNIQNDLVSLIFERSDKSEFTPVCINRGWTRIRGTNRFRNQKEKWAFEARDTKKLLDRLSQEKLTSSIHKLTLLNRIKRWGKYNFYKKDSRLRRIFKHEFNRYVPESFVIGSFFTINHEDKFMVFLAHKDLKNLTVKINGSEKEIFSKVLLGDTYEIIKVKIYKKDFGKEYKVSPEADLPEVEKGKYEISGNIPKLPTSSEQFTFFVYGDYRKLIKGKLHGKKSVALETAEHLEKEKGVLHILTGDLVLDGGSIPEWLEYIEKILIPSAKDDWVFAVTGNHDISSGTIGFKRKHFWFFNDTIPNFGNLFYFSEPNIISVNRHIERTQNVFKFGPIVFVHLPFVTEEVKFHYVETEGEEVGVPGRIRNIFRKWKTGRMSCYNYSQKIIDDFKNNLARAQALKSSGAVSFIIVCGHSPLVSTFLQKVPHKGLFNYVFEERLKKDVKRVEDKEYKISPVHRAKYDFGEQIYDLLKKYPIDAYFGGHNHIYGRDELLNEKNIPMITMGVGAKLYRSKKYRGSFGGSFGHLKKHIQTKQLISGKRGHRKFVGYLKCNVNPEENKIDCTLLGQRLVDGKLFDGYILNTSFLGKYAGKERGAKLKTYDRFEITQGHVARGF
jgi:hypothetical protein